MAIAGKSMREIPYPIPNLFAAKSHNMTLPGKNFPVVKKVRTRGILIVAKLSLRTSKPPKPIPTAITNKNIVQNIY
jgi:hypothetical protein